MTGGGVSVKQAGLHKSPGADGSSGSGTAAVARVVLPYHLAATNMLSIWQRGMPEETHQSNNFTELAKLVIENTSWKVDSFLGHSCLFPLISSLHLDLLSIIFTIQLLSLLT